MVIPERQQEHLNDKKIIADENSKRYMKITSSNAEQLPDFLSDEVLESAT